jgi:hypothetical protein
MSPTDFGFAKLISMHDESFFANFAVFNVQPRFTVVLPVHCVAAIYPINVSAGSQTAITLIYTAH